MPRVRPIPAGFGVAQIIFTCSGDTRTPEVTFGFTDDGATAVDDVADLFMDTWGGEFVPASLSTTWALSKALVTVNRGGTMLDGINADSEPGTAGFNAASLAVCMLARKGTGLSGKANRGRTYLPAGYLGENSVDQAGIIDPALVAATTTRIEGFRTSMAALGFPLVLIHSAISPAVPPAPTPVTIMFCENMVATQRRRQRKVSRH